MIKNRISKYLQQLLRELGETYKGLANRLGIAESTLLNYIKGERIPDIDVLLKIAELGGITLDELVKTDSPKIHAVVNKSHSFAIAGHDVYMNTKVIHRKEYKPCPDDITGEQANKLKELVNKIVDLERKVKKKAKTYGAVWNALNKKMGVTYYREIKLSQFEAAEAFLKMWIGRLLNPQAKKDTNLYRTRRYKAIFAATKNQLGWSKSELNNYIFSEYGVSFITKLDNKQLNSLYHRIMRMRER